MERFINGPELTEQQGGNLAKVLIATLYSPDAVLLAATRLSADRLVLLVDENPTKELEQNLKLIKDSLGRVIEVKTVKVKVYDVTYPDNVSNELTLNYVPPVCNAGFGIYDLLTKRPKSRP